jgi:acylphosphatase
MQQKPEKAIACAYIVVSGHVQGVLYRASMRNKADALGLAGWVKNTPDGRVEAVLQGYPNAVRALIEWARSGPPRAEVQDVVVSWKEPEQEGREFRIL